MVEEHLSETMIQSGAELAKQLENAGLHPDAVFWYYDDSPGKWIFVVVDRRVGEGGSHRILQDINDTLVEASDEVKEIVFDRIALMSPTQRLAKSILSGAKEGRVKSGRRLTGTVAGSWIEDAYIYRAA